MRESRAELEAVRLQLASSTLLSSPAGNVIATLGCSKGPEKNSLRDNCTRANAGTEGCDLPMPSHANYFAGRAPRYVASERNGASTGKRMGDAGGSKQQQRTGGGGSGCDEFYVTVVEAFGRKEIGKAGFLGLNYHVP